MDDPGWELLYEHFAAARAILCHQLDLSFEDAEDALQRAVQEFVELNRSGPPPEWNSLVRRGAWRGRDIQRRRRRDEAHRAQVHDAAVSTLTDEAALSRIAAERVRWAIASLPDRERRDLLGKLDGYTDDELRDGRDSVAAVQSSRARARRHLRKLLPAGAMLPRWCRSLTTLRRLPSHSGSSLKVLGAAVGCATVVVCVGLHPPVPGSAATAPPTKVRDGAVPATTRRSPQHAAQLSASTQWVSRPAYAVAGGTGASRPGPTGHLSRRTVAAVSVSDGSGDSAGGAVQYGNDGRSLLQEVEACLMGGLSLDPRHAGCGG